MKGFKKVISIILLLALVVGVAGCNAVKDYFSPIKFNESREASRPDARSDVGSALETDVVKLGSPIYVEDTVDDGWDVPFQEVSCEELIIDAVEAAGVEDGMLQVDAIRLINEYLCKLITYTEGVYARTVYGALYYKRCVCVGHALAFMYMCHYCGIDAVYVHGFTSRNPHAWNGVYFSDGTYLEVDVCYGSVYADYEKYCLITPEEMTAFDHYR